MALLMESTAKGGRYRKKGARLTGDADKTVLLQYPGSAEEYRYLLNHIHLIEKRRLSC